MPLFAHPQQVAPAAADRVQQQGTEPDILRLRHQTRSSSGTAATAFPVVSDVGRIRVRSLVSSLMARASGDFGGFVEFLRKIAVRLAIPVTH
jgi:hypothetical protein